MGWRPWGQWDLFPFLVWLFSQLILWHLLPRDVDHGCQDCTLFWREGKGLEGAQQPRSHLEICGEAPPTTGYRVMP